SAGPLRRALRGERALARFSDRDGLQPRNWRCGRQRAAGFQSMGRCGAYRGRHGSFRSAWHGAGDRGSLSAATRGFSVPSARQLLYAACRRRAYVRSGGPAVTDRLATAPRPGPVRAPLDGAGWALAYIGRPVRPPIDFVMMLAALAFG